MQLALATRQSFSGVSGRLGELARLLRTELRDVGDPIPTILAELVPVGDGVESSSRGTESMVERLRRLIEIFDNLRSDLVRRAFATALAVSWFSKRAGGGERWFVLVAKATKWLGQAPLGGGFWKEAVDRSKLLP